MTNGTEWRKAAKPRVEDDLQIPISEQNQDVSEDNRQYGSSRELSPVPGAGLEGSSSAEPRFFIDHGMIHDRLTGRHVTTAPDDETWNGGTISSMLQLLLSLSQPISAETDRVRVFHHFGSELRGVEVDGQSIADFLSPRMADLIADAIIVFHATGLTPTQLKDFPADVPKSREEPLSSSATLDLREWEKHAWEMARAYILGSPESRAIVSTIEHARIKLGMVDLGYEMHPDCAPSEGGEGG